MDTLDNHTLIEHVRDDIRTWAAERGVRVYVSLASTARRALEMLATPPNGLFVVIFWEGEDTGNARSNRSHVAEQEFSIFVSQQQSLKAHPGEDIMDGGPNGAPGLLQQVNAVRDRVRGLVFPDGTVDPVVSYRGSKQVFDPQEVPVPLNAFQLRFALSTFLPERAEHSWQKPAN